MARTLHLDFTRSDRLDPRITFSRASSATRTNANGLIEVVPAGTPRRDFDPVTGVCKGLLVEEQRTNLLTYSEQFDNAAWGKGYVSIISNTTYAPDGTLTADKLQETAVTNYFAINTNPSASNSTTYTHSIYAKAGERTSMQVSFTASPALVIFNLANGTVTSATGSNLVNASIESVGNGWYRCRTTLTTPASGSNLLYHIVGTAVGINTTFAGVAGYGIYIWGAQLEAGAFPTSVIPTSGAQATRVADVATITGTNFSSFYNQNEGTLFVECITQNGTVVAGVGDTFSDAIYITRGAANNLSFRSGGLDQAVLSAPFNAASGYSNKIALCYKTNDFAAVANGGTVSTDTSGSVPTSAVRLKLGSTAWDASSSNNINGHIRTLDYYNTRLPNATLQALTAPTTSGVAPTRNLDFTKSDRLDPRITFSRASTATYTGSDGLIKTAQAGQPRRDFDPITLQPKGLLIEEQRTNLLTYSEQFDNAAWTKSGATTTANVIAAPDGSLTADKVVEDTSSVEHYARSSPVSCSAGTYVASVYWHISSERSLYLRVVHVGETNPTSHVLFDKSTLTLSPATGNASASAQNVGNGWWRISLVFSIAATRNVQHGVQLWSNAAVYTGDGTSGLYLWGAQLEAGAFPTSYIPTTSAQATRAADVATMTGTNFSSWYNQSEGTLFAEAASVSSTRPVVAVDDGTMSNRYQLSLASSYTPGFAVVSGGAVSADLYAAAATQNSYVKEAGAYEVNAFAFSANGGSVVTDASGNLPVSVNILRVGAYQSGPILNGWIKRIAYFPKRLSNTELQTLTS